MNRRPHLRCMLYTGTGAVSLQIYISFVPFFKTNWIVAHLSNSADKAFAGAFLFHGKNFSVFLKKSFFCQDVVKVCMILCNHSKGKPRKHGAEQKNKPFEKSGYLSRSCQGLYDILRSKKGKTRKQQKTKTKSKKKRSNQNEKNSQHKQNNKNKF